MSKISLDLLHNLPSDGGDQGGSGDDDMQGDVTDNTIDGNGGDDNIDGGDGNDTLADTQGTNTLSGGAGNDLFQSVSGGGVNHLTGGAGTAQEVEVPRPVDPVVDEQLHVGVEEVVRHLDADLIMRCVMAKR